MQNNENQEMNAKVFPHHEAMLMTSNLEIATRINPDTGVCEKYQRDISEAKIRRALRNYNENIDNPIKVSYRDGHYYIWDGQHTKELKLRRNKGKDLPVRCMVYEGMTYDDEAYMFILQNGTESKPSAREIMKANWQIGSEPEQTIKGCVDSLNITFDFTRGSSRNKIVCYSAIKDIFTKYGYDVLYNALLLDIDCFNRDDVSFSKEIIYGMAIVYNTFKNDTNFDRSLFIRKVGSKIPKQIINQGKEIRYGGMKRFAIILCNIYNTGQSKRFLDASKLQ